MVHLKASSKSLKRKRDITDREQADQEGGSAASEESEGDDDHLHGFSTDEDSSDEESDASPEFDMGKLPTIAKDDETVKRKLDKAKRQPVRSFCSSRNIFLIAP
jgi:nucleolar protein 15